MINLAFWFDAPYAYSGGLNYLANLLYALSKVNKGEIRPYIFFSTDVPEEIISRFKDHSLIVRTKILKRYTFPWLVHKLLYRLLGSMWMINWLLKIKKIDILSHVWFPYFGKRNIKLITWIPDFQYLHMPEMFPGLNIKKETNKNRKIAICADAVIVSSESALNDLLTIESKDAIAPVSVLHFVSQPYFDSNNNFIDITMLEKKYGFSGKYFLLPNQFWAHKNHEVVISALAIARSKGHYFTVLMTGNTKDYRLFGSPYIDKIKKYIQIQSLNDCVKILGLINYSDLLALMRHCVAVINPSKFEGWSSSVEEAKSIGKPVLLSAIPVHFEQAAHDAHYFDTDDSVSLERLMDELWKAHDPQKGIIDADSAQNDLIERTKAFGAAYLKIIHQVMDKNPV